MEIKTVQFNSRDAQWSESVKLSREDCAAVYHVNPAMIWPGSGQTYASARDNARALYNDPEVLVLDEATSALDNETEKAVIESINALQGEKTLIIVAHRLSTIAKCDKIYEVKNGQAILRSKESVIGNGADL